MQLNNTLSDGAVLEELGQRLAAHRLARNMTQASLAQEAGVSKRTVERLEAGESVQLSNFIRMLRVLGFMAVLDQLIAEPLPSPMQQLRLQGKQRRRASPAKSSSDTDSVRPGWEWDES